tara:strand:- start:633 stop:1022 length:390 start_codon:yes stop_codon:yes gene_type:complete
MKRSTRIKPEGIMNLHEAKRYVSAPDPAAEEHEYLLNLFHDALDRRIIPPDTSFERFKKELHDYDYGFRRKKTPVRYAAKDEKPPRYDLNKPIRPQDFNDWAITLGTLDAQGLESIRFILDKLQEQNKK